MEIVHDLDVEVAEVARQQGKSLSRAATVCTTAAFASMVASLVAERTGPEGRRQAIGRLAAWPDQCPIGHCPGAGPAAGGGRPAGPQH
jgi:hypothetical protein